MSALIHTPAFATADVAVAGGGLTGAAMAWSLATSGARVVVIEPTGVLGREITRQRSLFIDVDAPEFTATAFGAALAEELIRLRASFAATGSRPAGLDPIAVGLALDGLLDAAGVEVLFQCLPTRPAGEGAVAGLEIATRNGEAWVEAPLVIDASRTRRIAVTVSEPIADRPSRTGIRLLVDAIADPHPSRAVLEGAEPVSVIVEPTFWQGEVRVEAVVERDVADADVAPLVARVVEGLPGLFPQLRDAVVTVVAEESVRAGGVRFASGLAQPGVVLAGEWSLETDPLAGDAARVQTLLSAADALVPVVAVAS